MSEYDDYEAIEAGELAEMERDEAIAAAVIAEREACAKLAFEFGEEHWDHQGAAHRIADLIRARSAK